MPGKGFKYLCLDAFRNQIRIRAELVYVLVMVGVPASHPHCVLLDERHISVMLT